MDDDWFQFYYLRPRPERFVEEVRRMSAAGVLGDLERALPVIVFLSSVMAANAVSLRAWLAALSELPQADLRSLRAAVAMSGVAEGAAYLAEVDPGRPLSAEPPPDLLEAPIDNPAIMDALWARYFATGDTRAVRRIITALAYMSDVGAAKAYASSRQTDADRARAMRDALFQTASWSLESLMQTHERLKAFCGDLVRSDELDPTTRCALAITLERVEPALWSVKIDTQTSIASIKWMGDS